MGKKAKPDSGTLRLLDANLNRAREGLRVLEDTARFVWDDRGMFLSLRDARHDLDELTRTTYPSLLGGRDSEKDMGRPMAEPEKRAAKGLVPANFRRAQEALRVLEEYGKVFSPGASSKFKSLRFSLYALEKKAVTKQ